MKAVFKIIFLFSLILFSYELTKCTSDLDCKAENNEEKCEILEGETEGICLYKDENKSLYKRDENRDDSDDSYDDSSFDDSYDDDSSSDNNSKNKDGNSKSNFIKYTIFTFACLFL